MNDCIKDVLFLLDTLCQCREHAGLADETYTTHRHQLIRNKFLRLTETMTVKRHDKLVAHIVVTSHYWYSCPRCGVAVAITDLDDHFQALEAFKGVHQEPRIGPSEPV